VLLASVTFERTREKKYRSNGGTSRQDRCRRNMDQDRKGAMRSPGSQKKTWRNWMGQKRALWPSEEEKGGDIFWAKGGRGGKGDGRAVSYHEKTGTGKRRCSPRHTNTNQTKRVGETAVLRPSGSSSHLVWGSGGGVGKVGGGKRTCWYVGKG